MKASYPIIITKCDEPHPYFVTIPDFGMNTEGDSIADAMEMARDAIGVIGIDMEDDKKPLPLPSTIADVSAEPSDIVTLVDVDFGAYRRKHDRRTVRRTVAIPSYLNEAADEAGLNVSAILRDALKHELQIAD